MEMFDAIPMSKRQITDEGYMLVPAVYARSGIYEYTAGQIGFEGRPTDQKVRVYRPASEVFDEESMASFGNKPVTLEHPVDPITVDSFNKLAVGMSDSKVTRDRHLLCGTILITDPKAISAINGGKVQLSNGYSATYDFLPGVTPEGFPYDAIQRRMRGNHIAIVDRGRCGHECAVADEEENDMANKTATVTTTDGKQIQVPQAVADQLKTITAQRDSAIAQLAKRRKAVKDAHEEEEDEHEEEDEEEEEKDGENPFEKMKKDAEEEEHEDEEEEEEDAEEEEHPTDSAGLRKKLARVEAQRDHFKAQITTGDSLDSLVETRSSIVTQAKRLMGKKYTTDGKTNAKIRREVVTALVDDAVKGKSDDYIEARFDGLGVGGGEAARFAGRNLSHRKMSDGVASISDAREAQMVRDSKAWDHTKTTDSAK